MPDHTVVLNNETETIDEPLTDAGEQAGGAPSQHASDDAACQACACTQDRKSVV